MSEKIYDVPAEWRQRAFIDDAKYQRDVRPLGRGPERLLGRAGQAPRLDQAVHQGQEHLLRSAQCLDQMVRGRHAQRRLQLHRPAPGRRAATRSRSSGKATTRRIASTSPIASCTTRSAGSPTCCQARSVKKGDRVTIYLPMIPEAAFAMLACARHRRGPFGRVRRLLARSRSPAASRTASPRCVITADEGLRGGRKVPLKANADAALDKVGGVDHVIVVKRTGGDGRHEGRPRRLVPRGRRRR